MQFFACCSTAFHKNNVRTAEKRMLQCNFCSATFRKPQCNFCFRLWRVLQGWGLDGWGFGLAADKDNNPRKNHSAKTSPTRRKPLTWEFVRKEKAAQRGSFGPDIPADIGPKTSVRPSKSWQRKQAVWHGHLARTSMKELRSKKTSG